MKLTALTLMLLFSISAIAEQVDSYKASNGKTYQSGDVIKLGRGSAQNGWFVYLSTGGWAFAANGGVTTPQLDQSFTGTNVTVKKIKSVGSSSKIIFTVGAGGLSNYSLDIENAIATCEIADCKKDAIPVTIVSSPSKFDELKKLKELLDTGAITEEEYKAEKEKLLK